VDNNNESVNYSCVRSLPTLIFLKNGEEAYRLIGTYPQKTIEDAISKYLI